METSLTPDSVWMLWPNCRKYMTLESPGLHYTQSHFLGKSMATDWEPPPLIFSGKSKPLADFVDWALMAPVISERARDALGPLINPYVEFLPLGAIRKRNFFAINVLKYVDCLDHECSSLSYSPDNGRVVNVWKARFDPQRLEDVPVFKIPEVMHDVYVRRTFVDIVIEHQLRGAWFADPAGDVFLNIANRTGQNVIPGVPE